MNEGPRYGAPLQIGTLSADGSRVWDGRFWAVVRADPPIARAPALIVERRAGGWTGDPERRTFGVARLVLAVVVFEVLSNIHLTVPFLPAPGTLDSALTMLGWTIIVWFVVTYGSVVLILSIGRQGIDVLLLRAMVVGFVWGAFFFASIPVFLVSHSPWIVGLIWVGLVSAVSIGPAFTLVAALLNLIWYRSFRSLRPELWVFIRGQISRRRELSGGA